MKERKQTIISIIFLIIGILTFILQLFIFEAPDGILGFTICLISILTIEFSIIKLYKTNKKFKEIFTSLLDMLFNIN